MPIAESKDSGVWFLFAVKFDDVTGVQPLYVSIETLISTHLQYTSLSNSHHALGQQLGGLLLCRIYL